MSKKLNAHDKFIFILTPTVILIVLMIYLYIIDHLK